jgi:type III pantothenate kinase
MNGIIFEIEGYIEKLKGEYKDLKIILSGGDSKNFDKKLNYSILVDSNINLTGLNRILEYNAIKN